MGIDEVSDIIHSIAEGFEENAMQCLDKNSGEVLAAIKEQMYSGINGRGELLSPTYDNDPFFEEEGVWYHRSDDYMAWKQKITPPVSGQLIDVPPRPYNVPNLFINGKFYSELTAQRQGDMLNIDPGIGNGLDIVAKYGSELLDMADPSVEYFNRKYLMPSIESFFNDCGYK